MKKEMRSTCPLALALDVFGDRWTLLILRDLLIYEKSRYQEFLAGDEGIATNLLAQRLEHLVKKKILTRTKDPSNKKHVIYVPTERAVELLPILSKMTRWGLANEPRARSNLAIAKLLKNESSFRKRALGFASSKKGKTARRRRPKAESPSRAPARVGSRRGKR